MDNTTASAINKVMADLANTGGGTYEQGTFLPFTPKDGFAVAMKDGLKLPADTVTPSMVAWALRQVARENPRASFVGTWLDKGVVYFDAVSYCAADQRDVAIALGQAMDQLAIFDFSTKESVTL